MPEKHSRKNFLPVVIACVIMILGADIALAQADLEHIQDLVAANHILAQHGVLDGYGHVSVRHPGNPNHILISRSRPAALLTAADIVEVDLDGNPLDAEVPPLFQETFIHTETYRSRPDVHAIVHSHSPTVITFSVSSVPLRALSSLSAFIMQGVPIWDYRRLGVERGPLVDDASRGRDLAETLGTKAVVLMRNHGATIVGSSLSMAVGRSIYLEQSAQIQLQAMLLGGDVHYLELAGEAVEYFGQGNDYEQAWELWRRGSMPDAD